MSVIPRHTLLVLAGLEMKAARNGLTPAERIAHAEIAKRVDASRGPAHPATMKGMSQ